MTPMDKELERDEALKAKAAMLAGASEHAFGASAPPEAAEREGQPFADPFADPRPLPERYGRTRLTLLVRDPEWLFAYWEISDQDRLRHNLNQAGPDRRMALRVWDVSAGNGHGNGASHYDIVVTEFAESWYLHVAAPNRQWRVELGLLAPNGEFIAIASSNTVATPRSSVSDAVDEAWMRVDEERFEQVFRLSGGETRPSSAGASEEIEAGMGARLKRRILPQYLLGASEQLAAASEMRASEEAMRKREAPEGAAPFHLRVDCELVLYGATEADARVTVCGQPVALRPDGSFTLRFALPDGEFELPVKAVKSSGDQQREITPEVKRQTK